MTTTAAPGPLASVATNGAREVAAPSGAPVAAARGTATATAAPRSAPRSGSPAAAALLVLGSCTSLQAGAALAMRLFPVTGVAGATLLRLALAATVLLVLARPRVRGWRPSQWRAVALYGISLAGTNGFFYAALARLPLGTAVTIQFLGPLTLAAALSKRWRDAGWVGLAVAGVLILGLSSGHGTAGHPLNPAGVGFALISAAFWALYIVTGSRLSRAVPGRGGLAAGLAIGALVLLPFGARRLAGRRPAAPDAARARHRGARLGRAVHAGTRRAAPRAAPGLRHAAQPRARGRRAGRPRAARSARPGRRGRRDRPGHPRQRGRHHQPVAAGAPVVADTAFADTGGVGSHASPGSTTNV